MYRHFAALPMAVDMLLSSARPQQTAKLIATFMAKKRKSGFAACTAVALTKTVTLRLPAICLILPIPTAITLELRVTTLGPLIKWTS